MPQKMEETQQLLQRSNGGLPQLGRPLLCGLAHALEEPLPPFLHQPLLLAPAPLQVLVMEINGSHGKVLGESASC